MSGITTLVREKQFPNAPYPILITPLPIETLSKLLQPKNASFPIDDMLLGIVIPVKPENLNALDPMVVTLLGIVILVSPKQFSNALVQIDVTNGLILTPTTLFIGSLLPDVNTVS